jgi:saccharopine dehydrogenase-like NADP-dependent oxidoreductase
MYYRQFQDILCRAWVLHYICPRQQITMTKYQIALFGAGKSATVLIEFLKKKSIEKNWQIIIADTNEDALQTKVGLHSHVETSVISLENETARREIVLNSQVVISLMPPHLHCLLAEDCLTLKKHLLTASYIDATMKEKAQDIESNNLTFIYEMGLDPGIDHMSAMKLIHDITAKGGELQSFRSHCGGLIAPESDDNPWHYKISWNPKNIVNAGKAGAVYKSLQKEINVPYHLLFNPENEVTVPGHGSFAWYANRDSLSYIDLYGVGKESDFLRTTLRHKNFVLGWQYIVAWGFTNEDNTITTDGMTIADYFNFHIIKNASDHWQELLRENNTSLLKEDEKTVLKQLIYLGLFDLSHINKGSCSSAEVLQWILEEKWKLQPDDKDMIVMLHEINYTLSNRQKAVKSALVLKGDNSSNTAMAKTVGLPLGIAASLLVEGQISKRGLLIPVIPEIYHPVLKHLEEEGISFNDVELEFDSQPHAS